MTFLKKIGNYIMSKTFLINLGLILVAYVLLYLIFSNYLDSRTNHDEKIEVPKLIGKNQNNLANLLNESGLQFEVLDSIYDPSKVEGTIISQDPEPTSETNIFVKEGRKIKVRVSKRTQLVEMPDLVDKSQRFAESILRNRKFRYSLEYKPSQEAHGAVIDQKYKGKTITSGTKIPIGSKIILVVGRNEVGIPQELPNLYGLTIEEARQRVGGMINMEFAVSCDEGYSKADSLAARVVTQSPEYMEGARVASGSTIMVYASKDFSGDQPE